ncbi:MAG: CCA tRNA nucleotidyltransferase [Nitrospirae bacterium]|nr:CCA tRNA nucleotidyltransferase [Nitrospirota bacterium]
MSLQKKDLYKNLLIKKVFAGTKDIYLVGGFLRDLISQGVHSNDIDFVIKKNLKKTVSSIRDKLNGKLIELKKEHMLRIVLKNRVTLDFSRLRGDITDDLKTRDFTFNSLAWSPEMGLLDPFDGIKDLKKGIIRKILKQNFKDDPLRLLRAYRFSSEFCFRIAKKTRQTLKELSGDIRYPAHERITLEFLALLNGKCPIRALRMALEDGVLTEIISLSYNALERNINTISKIEENLKRVPKVHAPDMAVGFPQGLTYIGLLRLEGLLYSSKRDLLSLSTSLRKRLDIVGELMGKFKGRLPATLPRELVSPFAGGSFSQEAVAPLIDLLILTGKTGFIPDANRFLRIMKKGILSTVKIMAETGIKPSPELGKVIKELKMLEFSGVIRTKKDALRELKRL